MARERDRGCREVHGGRTDTGVNGTFKGTIKPRDAQTGRQSHQLGKLKDPERPSC